MKRLKQPVILSTIKNSQGHYEPIQLTKREKNHCDWAQRQLNERFGNDLGYEVPITTLTTVVKRVSEQKLFEVLPADFFAVKVGEGTWSTNLTTYRSFDVADEFETGVINTGSQDARLAAADAGVDSLNIKIFPWAKTIGWNIFDLEFAAKSGNWDLVAAKEKSRLRNWQLGIQRVAFLGARGMNGAAGKCLGFLNQPGVPVNTTVITQPISSMSPTDLKQFCVQVVEAYRSSNNRTAYPTHFTIPESDYNGLAAMSSADFPLKSTLQILEEMFQVICKNKAFKIQPLSYCDNSYSGLGYQQYVLSRYDEESCVMNLPLDYTSTLANSINNFQFQNAGYGQFSGVLVLRPLEMLYFQFVLS